VGFGWFECFLLFVVVEARNKLGSTLLTLLRSQISNLLLQIDVLFGKSLPLREPHALHGGDKTL
jgi:hypothetical protein